MKRTRKLMASALAALLLVALVPVVAVASLPGPPATVEWTGNYAVKFSEVAGADAYYILLFKDGTVIGDPCGDYQADESGFITYDLSERINESGEYWVEVGVWDPSGGITYYLDNPQYFGDRASTAKVNYTLPGTEMGIPTNMRWIKTVNGYEAAWDAPANADSDTVYYLQIYRYLPSGAPDIGWGSHSYIQNNGLSFPLSNIANWLIPGEYIFKVQTLSGDIEAIANSQVTVESPRYKLCMGIAADIPTIQNIEDPDDLLDVLKGLDKDEFTGVLQTDAAVAAAISDLEDDYIQDKSITVEQTTDAFAGALLTGGSLGTIGLGFNVGTGTATLHFSEPDSPETLDQTQFGTNYVQLDIELLDNTVPTSGALDVPIQITMPIPAGVNPTGLVILHHLSGGGYDTITPRINGDGTITFTISSLSLFSFANTVAAPNPKPDPGSDDSTSTAPVVKPPAAPTSSFFRVLARSLNQRSGPGTGWAKLGTLPLNALVEIVGFSDDGNWALTKNGTWLSMGYLVKVNAVSGAGLYSVNVKAGSSLNVRSGPGTGFQIIGSLASGTLVNALSIENGWAMIEYQGGYAYVSVVYLI